MFDVLILAVGKNEAIELNSFKNIIVEKINSDLFIKKKYFHTIWPFMNNLPGIIYKVTVDDEYGKLGCGDGLLNVGFEVPDKVEPYWLREGSENLPYDFSSLYLKDESRQEFERILNEILNSTSIGTLLFLCSCQSNDTEIIQGTLEIGTFIDLFVKGRIYSNICYIVAKKA